MIIMTAKIEIRRASKLFDTGGRRIAALENVDLDIRANQFVTLVGASLRQSTTALHRRPAGPQFGRNG